MLRADDVGRYKNKNDLTWHEENDRVHMDFMSSDVNAVYRHLGGTSESKQMKNGRKYQGTDDDPSDTEKCP